MEMALQEAPRVDPSTEATIKLAKNGRIFFFFFLTLEANQTLKATR